jgi:hypothetical protein
VNEESLPQEPTADAIQPLLDNVDDDSTTKILLGIQKVAQAVDRLRAENAAIRLQLDRLQEVVEQRPSAAERDDTLVHRDTPQFTMSISVYEVGELFEDDAAFDLRIEFADAESLQWYRVWNFADAGQTLHVLAEACARTKLPQLAEELTYCRDSNSVTIYAKRRVHVEALRNAFQAANATYDGALLLLDSISEDVRYQ